MNICKCGRSIRGVSKRCKSCAIKACWAAGLYAARRRTTKTRTKFYRVGYERVRGGGADLQWPPLIPLTEWGDDAA